MGNEPSKPEPAGVIRLPPEADKESEIIRHSAAKDGLISCLQENVLTLWDGFAASAEKYPDNPCFGWRQGETPYKWMPYKTALSRSKAVGAAIVKSGLKPHNDKVGIYSINRLEWLLVELGCAAYSVCVVPLYDTLGPEACAFITNQSELEIVFCTADKVKLLLDASDKVKSLKTIIQFDAVTDEFKGLSEKKGIKLIDFESFENSGKEDAPPLETPKPSDLVTICYTSGTTGDPKGVILTHGNFVAAIAGANIHGVNTNNTDIYISYLPLAHVMERVVVHAVLQGGGAIGFFRGEIPKLFDDIAELKPTIFVSVPRLWNRLYDKVMANLNTAGALKKTVFDNAFESKLEGLKEGYYSHALWDSVVFDSVKGKLGGRVRLMLTGSAPISPKVLEFLRVCFSCPVLEGYGQTENAAAACCTTFHHMKAGHVGFPFPCVELKLIDVPEMDYFATEKPCPRGEICLRGPIVTQGYYKDKEKTAEAIDEKGWLRTGDIGKLNEDGTISIIDRRKNIFKLSLGEYIAPEKIENVLVQSKWVAQSFVFGNSLKSSVVAIVVPDAETLIPWAKDNKKPETLPELCNDPEVKKMVLDDLSVVGKSNALRGFEFVRDIFLTPDPFTVQNDLLTPTFKIKRPQAKAAYNRQIDEMYQNLD